MHAFAILVPILPTMIRNSSIQVRYPPNHPTILRFSISTPLQINPPKLHHECDTPTPSPPRSPARSTSRLSHTTTLHNPKTAWPCSSPRPHIHCVDDLATHGQELVRGCQVRGVLVFGIFGLCTISAFYPPDMHTYITKLKRALANAVENRINRNNTYSRIEV
jgi:hypothetical protein